MNKKFYVYEIQAFDYSDFAHYILLHEKQFSEKEFKEMIDAARKKTCPPEDEWGLREYVDYPTVFIRALKEDFGFVESEHLVAYVGCDYGDECRVRR